MYCFLPDPVWQHVGKTLINTLPYLRTQNALVFLAVSVATVAAVPAGIIYSSPLTYAVGTPAVTLPAAVGPATPTKTGLATVNTVSEQKSCLGR